MLQGIVLKEDGPYYYVNGRIKNDKPGLTKIGDTTVQPDNEMTRGKINQISYLIRVEEMN